MHLMRKLNVAALLWAVATGVAFADTVALKANLQPSSEVPPNTSKAHGDLKATFDTSTKMLSWDVTYADLTGPSKMAHFHGPAPVGQNAKPVITIPPTQLGAAAGTIKGEQTLTDAQTAELMNGKWYFNIHTKQNMSGEIRGQVVPAN